MINYSEKTNFETFKRELLYDRFFCKTDDQMSDNYTYNYKQLPTDTTIKNSFIYRIAEKMLNNNSGFLKCNIKNIFNGIEDIGLFKKNFISAVYKESCHINKEDAFLESFNDVFSIIVTYPKSKVLDMYSLEDFNVLSNVVTNSSNNKSSVAYKFIWDYVGYSFGKIQFHLGSDIGNINQDGVNFLKGIDFTDSDIKLLTVTPKKYSVSKLKTDTTVRKEMNKRVSLLNNKLYKHKYEVDKFCKKSFFQRIELINSYNILKDIVFENELAYIQLIDYDNQLRFNKGGNLYNYLSKKISNKDYILTSREIVDYKLNQTEYGRNNPSDINRRNKNIVNNIKPVLNNAKLEDVLKIVNNNILFDIISINEIDYISDNIYVYNIVSLFKSEIFDVLGKDKIHNIDVDVNYNDEPVESQKETVDKKIEEINRKINIPLSFSEDTTLNAHNIIDMSTIMTKLFSEYTRKYFNVDNQVVNLIKQCNVKYIKLFKDTNMFTLNLDETEKSLEAILTECKGIYDCTDYDTSTSYSVESDLVCSYLENLCKAYGYMKNNEFAKTSLLATGIINKANAFLFSDDNAMQIFADSFLSKKPKIQQVENEEPNPLSIFFSKSDFLYMKELDYRNLEACLRQSSNINPGTLGCQRTWILIYIILNFIARKNDNYINQGDDGDFVNHVSNLLNKIRQQKWKYDYSDIEKHFSVLYPFAKYENNPFTKIMNDKGYNESQEQAKELRLYVEKELKDAINSIKEFVYGENKIYDIFQGLADIAYELSTPISLYTDLDFSEAGESVVNQFLNACVCSLEMQTAMTIYEFLFNFKIDIHGKSYTLNDLNNMLKMFNLIVEVSKDNKFSQQLENRTEICRNTSDYQAYKQIGFYTYNKKWNNTYDEMDDYIKEFTGFYLSDEQDLYDIVEYCRNKKVACKPGDLKTIVQRFNDLRDYEWLSAFACHKLRTDDKKYSNKINQKFYNEYGFGYLQIEEIVKTLEKEADNTNPEVSYLDPYIENLGNNIIKDPKEFEEFKSYNEEMFRRFRINMIQNEQKCISIINNDLSDNKIYDWMMKMLPTYEMIAKAFGFASLNGIATLDKFVDDLMITLNKVIKITFDKWKNETIETINVRRIQFIKKERYYYIQSIPVMIDWTIKNLEHYILGCNLVSKSDGIDYGQSSENLDKIDNIMKTFIIKLKEEVSTLSSLQIKEFKKKLEKSILTVDGVDKEKAQELIDDILQIGNAEIIADKVLEFDISFFSDEQMMKIIDNISKSIDFKEFENIVTNDSFNLIDTDYVI